MPSRLGHPKIEIQVIIIPVVAISHRFYVDSDLN
jgi:hypothetical protein